jgi:hypothetical protein
MKKNLRENSFVPDNLQTQIKKLCFPAIVSTTTSTFSHDACGEIKETN